MRLILIFLSITITLCCSAQNKMLSMDDAVIGHRSYLQPKRLAQLQWIAGTTKYSYVVKQNNREVVMVGEAGKTEPMALFASDEVAAKLAEAGVDSMVNFPAFVWENSNTIRFIYKNRFVWFDTNEKAIRTSSTWPSTAENLDIDPVKKQMAYTVDNNLAVLNSKGEKLIITNDENASNVYGAANVHRNEYGISKGTFWSPQGNYLAFYRMDESMVTSYPIFNIDTKPATIKNIKYPMAGGNSHQVSVGVFNLTSKEIIYLNIAGDREQYITNISWSRDERKIYLALLNRKTDSCAYQIYDSKTGKLIKTWAIFTAPTYVEPSYPLIYMGSSNKLIWRTYELAADKRATKEVIKIIDEDGNQLDKFSYSFGDAIADVFTVNDKGYFFTYYNMNSLNKSVGYQTIATGKAKQQPVIKLSMLEGTNTPMFCDNGAYFINTLQSAKMPRLITVNESVLGKPIYKLLEAENPLKDYKMATCRLITLKAEDGITDLNCRLIYPIDFDESKKYPSITYVYNGPHVQLVNNGWLNGADLWLFYMAQQGYIVLTIDGRGSANRGKEFEQVIHRQLGTKEIADQLKGNDYLRSLAYIDTNRMGVFGWSFGGFMTTGLMTRTPGKYKVGVAGGAVIDWGYYEIMYTERYMDMPSENPDGYAKADLKNYTNALDGKLLMIHGTSDDVVVWQHTLLYTKKCVETKKQVDYFMYPGHLHNVTGKDRVHLMQKITNYFNQNL